MGNLKIKLENTNTLKVCYLDPTCSVFKSVTRKKWQTIAYLCDVINETFQKITDEISSKHNGREQLLQQRGHSNLTSRTENIPQTQQIGQ